MFRHSLNFVYAFVHMRLRMLVCTIVCTYMSVLILILFPPVVPYLPDIKTKGRDFRNCLLIPIFGSQNDLVW